MALVAARSRHAASWAGLSVEIKVTTSWTPAEKSLFGFMACFLDKMPSSPSWAKVACAYSRYYRHSQVTHITNPPPTLEFCGVKTFSEPQGVSIEYWVSPTDISRKIDGSFAFPATGLVGGASEFITHLNDVLPACKRFKYWTHLSCLPIFHLWLEVL